MEGLSKSRMTRICMTASLLFYFAKSTDIFIESNIPNTSGLIGSEACLNLLAWTRGADVEKKVL